MFKVGDYVERIVPFPDWAPKEYANKVGHRFYVAEIDEDYIKLSETKDLTRLFCIGSVVRFSPNRFKICRSEVKYKDFKWV